jgi:hypothetical protein
MEVLLKRLVAKISETISQSKKMNLSGEKGLQS